MDLQQQIRAELEPHFKRINSGWHRYTCPWRTGADGETLAVNWDEGSWRDHKDDEGGRLPSLARRLGIELRVPVEDTARAYSGLAEYANAQGAPVEAFEEAHVQEGKKDGRAAIGFPMKAPDGEIQYQYRFLDGKKPKWKGQQGFQRCWYGLTVHTATMCFTEPKQPLVICNGAASVVVARHYGVPAVSIPGGENSTIPDELMSQLALWVNDEEPPQIIAAMDCDTKGRKVGVKMAEDLRRAGYDARAVDLGLGDKGDLANFCKLHGEDAMQELLECPTLTSGDDNAVLPVQMPAEKIIAHGRTWLMMHARDRSEIPPIEWIIPGEIPNRGLTVIYGTSGVGKSFFIIDRSLKIAQDAPVIYGALEGESGVPSRIDAWCEHHQKGVGELYLCLGEVNFFNSDEVNLFISGAKRIKPKLVVIDTLARAMGDGDENSTRDMNKLMALCKRLYTVLDCGVVLVHHTGKDGQQERGSYALRGASDSMIQLVDDDEFVQVECSKTKDAKPFQTYFMTLIYIDVGVVDAQGSPQLTPVIVPAERDMDAELVELTIRQRKVLEVMSQSIFEHGATPGQVYQVINGVPERSVYRVMSRLKDADLICQNGARKPYRLTDRGREMMGLPPLANDDNDTATTAINDTTVTTATLSQDGSKDNDSIVPPGRNGISGSNGSNGSKPLFGDEELRRLNSPNQYGY